MRKPVIVALLLISCGPDSDSGLPALEELAAGAPTGVELLALRVPRSGGRARVLSFPALDSTVWSSAGSVPAIGRVLAFDSEEGTLVFSDSRGIARSLDFRINAVSPASQLRLANSSSADGWNVYGITSRGEVARSTPSAMLLGSSGTSSWSISTPRPVREVFALQTGALIVIAADSTGTSVWKLFPPESDVADSLTLGPTSGAYRTATGDRIYLSDSTSLTSLTTRILEKSFTVRLRGGAREVVPTPSGNQLFVVGDSSNRVTVLDRYAEEITGQIEFPAPVRSLRMDPLGRFALAAPFAGDTAWIVALTNHRLVRSLVTDWRADLPHISWDAGVVVARGRDVLILDPVTLEQRRTFRNGASDYWYFFAWNGFRPRETGAAEPVIFASGPARVDTSDVVAGRGGTATGVGQADSVTRPTDSTQFPLKGVFTVSYAVLRDEANAISLARTIRSGSERARVVRTVVDNTPLFRVVMGPYPSKDEAIRIGQASGVSYWVYEGPP